MISRIAFAALFLCAGTGLGQARISIDTLSDIPRGERIEITVRLEDQPPGFATGGFDLLIAFDTSGLSYVTAEMGALLVDCEWEYFASFLSVHGLRLVAIADLNNGAVHPSCFASTPGVLARITLDVTENQKWECRRIPLRFMWYDCGDNTVASTGGDTLSISNDVYEYNGDTYIQVTCDMAFPSPCGAPDICLSGGGSVLRAIDFYNGSVEVECCCIGLRGNINGDPLEDVNILDLTYLVTYLFGGGPAPGCWPEANVNGDSREDVTIVDLTYLVALLFSGGDPPAPCP